MERVENIDVKVEMKVRNTKQMLMVQEFAQKINIDWIATPQANKYCDYFTSKIEKESIFIKKHEFEDLKEKLLYILSRESGLTEWVNCLMHSDLISKDEYSKLMGLKRKTINDLFVGA